MIGDTSISLICSRSRTSIRDRTRPGFGEQFQISATCIFKACSNYTLYFGIYLYIKLSWFVSKSTTHSGLLISPVPIDMRSDPCSEQCFALGSRLIILLFNPCQISASSHTARIPCYVGMTSRRNGCKWGTCWCGFDLLGSVKLTSNDLANPVYGVISLFL